MFALVKVATHLLLPLSAAMLMMTVAWILLALRRRRLGLALLAVGIGGLYAASVPGVSGTLRRAIEQRHPARPVEALPAADAIVVLGGGLSPAEPPRRWPDLNPAADRILHAARLYRAGKASRIVATGGVRLGGTLTQAEATAALLEELGVPREAILLAAESRNTYEDALGARAALARPEVDSLLLVTSALHMPRALATFRANGLPAFPSATDFEATRLDGIGPLAWIPDPEALQGTSRAVKEILGCVAYALRGWIPSPLDCLAAPPPPGPVAGRPEAR